MSKNKKHDHRFEKSIELGKKTNRLIPRIKNWCSKIEIHSEYGGIMGQMGYPTMNTISCSEARGDSAMNLEWIAHDFIVENCPGCRYHNEISEINFGRATLKNHERYISKIKEQHKKEAEIISKLEILIQEKISNVHENSKTTELSILKKLLELNNQNIGQTKISLELLEASKISPSFFNSLSNDYLSVFFDNDQFGNYLLEASFNIIKHDIDIISDFFIDKVIDLLDKEKKLNHFIKLLPISKLKKNEAFRVCKIVISRYDPDSFNRYDHFENHSPAILQFVYSFFNKYNSHLHELIEDNLKAKDGRVRAFASLIVFQLFNNGRILKFKIIDQMILSLDLDDYDYHPSPDFIITQIIANMHQKFPKEIKAAIERNKNRLKTGGKIELIRVYENILKKGAESTFLDELISIGLSRKEQDLRKKAIDILENISRTNGLLLLDKSDSVIGLLAHSIKNQITFEWYKKNLDNNTVTFNPLKNESIDSILLDENLMAYEIDKLKSISQNLLKIDEARIYKNLIDIVRNSNIRNENEKRLKEKLIEVIRDGIKDSKLLIDILPDLYNWLMDFKNPSLRITALKFVEKLLKNNHQIVPKTIFDLLEIFLEDQDNLVKKYTILCLKQLIRIDKKLDVEVIENLLGCYKNKYVVVHKTAVEITYDLFERLGSDQRLKLLQNLFHLFLTYNNEDYLEYEFRKRMFRQVMFVSKEINPKHKEVTEPMLVTKYLSNYCLKGDYYSRLDSLKDLAAFKNRNTEYENIWLKNSLLFLNQFLPHRLQGFWDSDRYTLYKDFFTLTEKTILNHVDSIKMSTKESLARDFDLYRFESLFILSIFSFFNLFKDSEDLIKYIEERFNPTKSSSYFFEQLDVFKNFSNAFMVIYEEKNTQQFADAINNLTNIVEELLQFQAEIFSKRIILFIEFNINALDKALSEKEYMIGKYEYLVKISNESKENDFFIAHSLLCKGIFSFLEWGRAILNGDSIQHSKLVAAKANFNLINRSSFAYLPSLEKGILDLIENVNNVSQFNETSFKNILHSYASLKIPIIYHLTKDNKIFRENEFEEIGEKLEEINLVSIELYLRNVPWANPQIIKPKEIYKIEGKVRINKIPEGYEILHIVPASTNNKIYDLLLDEIKLSNSTEYKVSGNILFKYPLNDLDQNISIKLVPYYERGGVKLYPSVIGYDELIGKVIDESNELFQTGFDMMNKKVFEFYKNPLIKQLGKSEITDFFKLLNAIINYQGFCLQNGIYKKITSLLENEFRDNLIQHLTANPLIGGEIRKETEVAGGKVEIEFRGFIVELKVEKKLSDRKKIIEKYESQTQSYASGYSKLGSIVCILDLTQKEQAPSPAINNIHLTQPKTHGFDNVELVHKPFQIFIFIDGNTKNPSEYSTF